MAGSASVLVPPTTAHNTVENAINSIQLQESTAIGEGIATALRALQQAPKDPERPGRRRPRRDRPADRRHQHRRPRPAPGRRRSQGRQGPDLHHRLRHRERLRRSRRQARARPGRPRADAAGRRCHRRRVLQGRHRRSVAAGVREHRVIGRLRKSRPRGDLPLRRVRPGASPSWLLSGRSRWGRSGRDRFASGRTGAAGTPSSQPSAPPLRSGAPARPIHAPRGVPAAPVRPYAHAGFPQSLARLVGGAAADRSVEQANHRGRPSWYRWPRASFIPDPSSFPELVEGSLR